MNKKVFVLMSLLLCGVFQSKAQDYRFKSLYLYNFTKNIKWPSEELDGTANTKKFIIGVIGYSPIVHDLQRIAQVKKVGTQQIQVRICRSLEEVEGCSLIFIPQNKSAYLKKICTVVQDKPSVIITEKKGLLEQGAHINFIEKDGKLRYEIQKEAFEKSGVAVSAILFSHGV